MIKLDAEGFLELAWPENPGTLENLTQLAAHSLVIQSGEDGFHGPVLRCALSVVEVLSERLVDCHLVRRSATKRLRLEDRDDVLVDVDRDTPCRYLDLRKVHYALGLVPTLPMGDISRHRAGWSLSRFLLHRVCALSA